MILFLLNSKSKYVSPSCIVAATDVYLCVSLQVLNFRPTTNAGVLFELLFFVNDFAWNFWKSFLVIHDSPMSVISRSEICLKIEVFTFDWVHWCWHSNPYPFIKLLGYSAWILVFNATRHSFSGFSPLQNLLISSSKLATLYSFMDIEYPRYSLFRYFIICHSNLIAKWQWHLHNPPPPHCIMIDCD